MPAPSSASATEAFTSVESREEVVVEHHGADRGALVGRDGADLGGGLHEPSAGVELRLLRLDLGCAFVELRLLGGELLGAAVELRLLGFELCGGLVVRAGGLRLCDGGVQLRLVRIELRLARVELGLAGVELLRGGVELRLAVVELLLLVGAVGCRGERVDRVGDAVELADVGEERAISSCCSAVKAEPSSVWNTTVPVAPPRPDSSSLSCALTRSVSVPGMLMLEVSVPPKARKPPTASASAASQATSTVHGRRAEKRPRRYRSSAIAGCLSGAWGRGTPSSQFEDNRHLSDIRHLSVNSGRTSRALAESPYGCPCRTHPPCPAGGAVRARP